MRLAILVACRAVFLLGAACSLAWSQPVFTPRGMALGAYAPVAGDVRGFLSNPAGLPGMRDWDAEVVTSLPGNTNGFIFDGVAVGKRFLDRHALAFQYSPGAELDFLLPSTLRVSGLEFAVDKTIKYREPFAAGYGVRLSPVFSAGFAVRLRSETVSDPDLRYLDTTIVTVANEAQRSSMLLDVGLRWQVATGVTLSALGRGIPVMPGGHLPQDFRIYELPQKTSLEAGVLFSPVAPLGLAVTGGTLGTGSVGVEWRPIPSIGVRGSVYADRDQSPFMTAFGVGAGWTTGPIELEAGYLRFTSQTNRGGSVKWPELTGAAIQSIGMNPFSPDRLSFGMKVSLGNVHESALRIVGLEMLTAVFPSSSQTLAYKPIARLRVQNITGVPVEAHASFFVDHLMDAPTESGVVTVAPGQEADIPLTAVFNESLQRVASVSVREGIVQVSSSETREEDDRTQPRVVVRGRNDWDGNAQSLRFFVRPDDPEVLRTTRDILLQQRDSLEGVPAGLEPFRKAQVLFNAFAGKLVYISDPKLSADFVQYPDETLKLRGGDCDDMTACFASLLTSVGIATAFVDVVPPDHPENAHIYLMFDTGLDPTYASYVAQNPKRFIVRRSTSGGETVWVPVETTVIMKGFEEAWNTGAREYYDDAEVNLGLAKGWVKIVDVQ